VDSGKVALSRLTHQRVTQTVSQRTIRLDLKKDFRGFYMLMKRYRLSWKAIAGEFLVIIIVLPFLLSSLGVMFYAIRPPLSGWYSTVGLITSFVVVLLGLLLLFASLILCLLPLGRAIFSYLAVSDSGIDYRYWPFHRIRGTWQDVDEIYQSPLPFQGEMLRLKRADVSGYHINIDFKRGNLGASKTLPVIPLYLFSGWINRELQVDLKNYAPNLFVNAAK